MTPRVFTIPASAPFLPTLIEALRNGTFGAIGDDPLALASATLYLPTRRACRLMRDAFLQAFDAAILPRIVAIGDIDEDEIAFAEAAAGGVAAEALALPEALGGLERRLLLTQLISKWAQSPELHGASGTPLVAQTAAAACALADDLARLIDDMTMRGVSWDRLDELVPDKFDVYWQLTLRFLQIAHKAWPAVLRERECIEPAERRDRLIKAEAARLARKTDGLVIAAGSTGSIPATAELIATIAHLPHGAVVLPGLDTDLDEESWQLIAGDDKKKSRRRRRTRNSRCKPCWRASASRAPMSRRLPRHLPCLADASTSSPRLCARRRQPTAGGRYPPTRLSPPMPMPRCRRSR